VTLLSRVETNFIVLLPASIIKANPQIVKWL
jgi:hypothetical protein